MEMERRMVEHAILHKSFARIVADHESLDVAQIFIFADDIWSGRSGVDRVRVPLPGGW